MEAQLGIELDGAGRDTDGGMAATAVVTHGRVGLFRQGPEGLEYRVVEGIGMHGTVPTLVLRGVALAANAGVLPLLRGEFAMALRGDVGGGELLHRGLSLGLGGLVLGGERGADGEKGCHH
jgi:hypothetical protein